MNISVQYIEGGAGAAGISAAEARARLRDAMGRVPIAMVLLGWDLDPRVVEACADECARNGSELYLWQPLLTGHGPFRGDPQWRVIGLSGEPAAGIDGKSEFTFICPNQPQARESILRNLSDWLAGGPYRGVFLDRIRFPSPASDFTRQFGCFCDACQAAARDEGLDLVAVREAILRLQPSRAGRRAIISTLFDAPPPQELEAEARLLRRMLLFREQSITRFVRDAAALARSLGLKVGLDCFSPTLCRMVGQDLRSLAECAAWIKVMTYARAFAPASLPYEIMGFADWLACADGETMESALAHIAEITGWALPRCAAALRGGGLPANMLTDELCKGRAANPHPLLAGIELVELPGVTELSLPQIRADAEAVRAGKPDGVVLCWDLWHIPAERLELAVSLYGG